MMKIMTRRTCAITSLALASTLALASCANEGEEPDLEDEQGNSTQGGEATESASAHESDDTSLEDDHDDAVEPSDRATAEAAGPQPRLAITHDGGVAVLDGSTLEELGNFDAEGFLRVNPAGDGRHFFLTEGDSFRLIDGGTWGAPHGDHNHYYTTDPLLTDITVDGSTPGHVVSHDGIGALFFDGSGEIHSYDLSELDAEMDLETTVAETGDAHHGVAVVFEDGSRFETIGTESERTGARVVDSENEEIARNEECPGVHGEAAGPDGMIAVGCEDGALIWDGGEFTKIQAGPEFARTGNLFPSEGSNIFLGDYRTDQDEPMTEVALVDAANGEITTADIGAAYNFRSLARGPEGEGLVLAEDGLLHVLDAETGELVDQLDVLDEWSEPEEWQEPRPAIRVIDDIAYITDPDNQELHMVDLNDLEIINSVELGFVPNEIAGIDGRPVEGVSGDFEEQEGSHAHDDEDHDHDHSGEDHDH